MQYVRVLGMRELIHVTRMMKQSCERYSPEKSSRVLSCVNPNPLTTMDVNYHVVQNLAAVLVFRCVLEKSTEME